MVQDNISKEIILIAEQREIEREKLEVKNEGQINSNICLIELSEGENLENDEETTLKIKVAELLSRNYEGFQMHKT